MSRSILSKPNICIGSNPVKKIITNNTTTELLNYFPITEKAIDNTMDGNSGQYTIIKAFDKLFAFPARTVKSEYLVSEDNGITWKSRLYRFTNVRTHADDVYWGGGFNVVSTGVTYGNNRLLVSGYCFNSRTASNDQYSNGYYYFPPFSMYTTTGDTWLTGGFLPTPTNTRYAFWYPNHEPPYSVDTSTLLSAIIPGYQRQAQSVFGNGKFVIALGGNPPQSIDVNPYLELQTIYSPPAHTMIPYSTDANSWSSGTAPFSAHWNNCGYGGGKFIIFPYTSLSAVSADTVILTESLSAIYSTDGINWQASSEIYPKGQEFKYAVSSSGPPLRLDLSQVYYCKDKYFCYSCQPRLSGLFLYSYDGATWQKGNFPDWSTVAGKSLTSWSNFANALAFSESTLPERHGKYIITPYSVGGSNIELHSTDAINWTAHKRPLSATIGNIFPVASGQDVLFEGGLNSEGWRGWITNPSEVPKYRTLYTANFIPLKVSVEGTAYSFDQVGTNNPTLTCYRGTNYDFIMTSSVSSYPFAFRANLNNTSASIGGSYNNDANNGLSAGKIMFTPNNSTPNDFYYQCVNNPSISGVVIIKNY